MGFATHLGPWLLGTVKDTTGTTAGTIRNTGCTTVARGDDEITDPAKGETRQSLPPEPRVFFQRKSLPVLRSKRCSCHADDESVLLPLLRIR